MKPDDFLLGSLCFSISSWTCRRFQSLPPLFSPRIVCFALIFPLVWISPSRAGIYTYCIYILCAQHNLLGAGYNACTFHPNPSIARAGVRAGSDGIVYIPCDREVLSTIQIRVLISIRRGRSVMKTVQTFNFPIPAFQIQSLWGRTWLASAVTVTYIYVYPHCGSSIHSDFGVIIYVPIPSQDRRHRSLIYRISPYKYRLFVSCPDRSAPGM